MDPWCSLELVDDIRSRWYGSQPRRPVTTKAATITDSIANPSDCLRSPARTGKPPQQLRALRTRTRVLDSTARLIAAHGQFGVQDLVNAGDLTKGSIYFHFGSKDAIVEAVIADAGDTVRSHLTAATAGGTPHPADVAAVFLDCVAADHMVAATCVLWHDRDHHDAARAATGTPLRTALSTTLRTWHPDETADRTTDVVVAVIAAHTATPGITLGPDERAVVSALVDHALATAPSHW